MSNKNLTIGLIAVAIIAIGAFFFPIVKSIPPAKTGGVANYDNLQLSKLGTSTLSQVGCLQLFATSTLTPVIVSFNTTSSTTTPAGQSSGMLAWTYGTCGSPVGL